jgi:hypothetical protein
MSEMDKTTYGLSAGTAGTTVGAVASYATDGMTIAFLFLAFIGVILGLMLFIRYAFRHRPAEDDYED